MSNIYPHYHMDYFWQVDKALQPLPFENMNIYLLPIIGPTSILSKKNILKFIVCIAFFSWYIPEKKLVFLYQDTGKNVRNTKFQGLI